MPEECQNAPKTDTKECCKIQPNFDVEKIKSCWAKNDTKAKSGKDGKSKDSKESKTSSDSKAGGFCAASDCVMNNLGYLKNGAFDADLAKSVIAAMKKDNAWTKVVSLSS
jgi:hypothetical protein